MKQAEESLMPAFIFLTKEKLMARLNNSLFIVIKRDDTKYLDYHQISMLQEILQVIELHKGHRNKYYVCNQDEPYAKKVKQIILEGEDKKLRNNCSFVDTVETLRSEIEPQQTPNTEGKENTTCPSYDCEYCETSPTPYQMKCKDISNCIWKDRDFNAIERDEKLTEMRDKIISNSINAYIGVRKKNGKR